MIVKATRDATAYAACHRTGVAPFETGFEPGFICGNTGFSKAKTVKGIGASSNK